MASTQNLTELPIIQATGMDYSSVIAQIIIVIGVQTGQNFITQKLEHYLFS